ncbi:receptor-type tyrosine-protein phosphatase C-like [Dreissena polymorpha]|nr:receptor-type tyrosine-protein phosphatase C-like [Dreissena polymorpha]
MQDLPPVEYTGTTIALTQLQGYVMSKSAEENYFIVEFKIIPYGLQHPNTAATATMNAGKNRYKDTYAYDHSRVVLNTVDGNEGSDYINACFIEGFNKKRAYIASQGPTETMMDDFWRMIWQYDISTVVMVTNLVEMGKMKCLRYWPLEVGSQKDFQAITTTFIFMEEFTDYTVRKLKLSHKDKPSVSRVVTNFHYTAWPDKDVPASTSSLLHFWRRVRAHDPDK